MKRTRSMIYKESDESRELFLYSTNNDILYHSSIVPIVRNLAKKYSKGNFDKEKAIDAFYYAAENGASEAGRMQERTGGFTMNRDYHVSKPYDRAIWKGGEIIGTVCLSRTDADAANKLSGAVFYIGFTEEEHILLRDGTSEELKKAGFLD